MKIKIILVLLALSIYSYNFGQSVDEDSLTSSIDLDQVVISANKYEIPQIRMTQEVKVIGNKQINFLQAQTSADLLQSTGSVYIQRSQQGGGSTVLRGFEANRVLLMIDGVRMNNAIYRGGHLQNVISVDNNTIDRIEVLYGPSSTMYGSDALGGVIHFYTKKPLFKLEENDLNIRANAFLRYGSANNEKTGHFDLNIGGSKLASLTSVTYSSFDDLIMGKTINPALGRSFGERPVYVSTVNGVDALTSNDNKYKQVQSGYDQYDILQKFSYKPNSLGQHGLNLQYSNTTNIPRYDRLTDLSDIGLSQAQWYYGPQKRMLIAYDYDRKKDDLSPPNVHFGLSFQDVEESRNNRRFNSSKLSSRIENIKVYGMNIDLNKTIGKHQLFYGADLQYNDLKSTAFATNIMTTEKSTIDTRYPDGVNTFLLSGIYLSHSLEINDQWTLNDGGRLGYSALRSTFIDKSFFPLPFDEAVQNNFLYSANLGLAYHQTNKTKVSVAFSTGFRSPNIDDMSKVFETAPGSIIVPNPDLQPEKTINTELNITHQLSPKLKVQGLVYYTWLRDAIVSAPYTFDGKSQIVYDGVLSDVFANQNQRKATVTGFSAMLEYKLNKHLAIEANTTYTYGRLIDEATKPLDHIPPMLARAALNYQQGKWSGSIYSIINGWKRIDKYSLNGEDNEQYAPAEGMPSWYTINLRGKYSFNNHFSISLGLENMLDLQYRTFSSGINAPGRNISITASGSI